jgi:hypothetical protein
VGRVRLLLLPEPSCNGKRVEAHGAANVEARYFVGLRPFEYRLMGHAKDDGEFVSGESMAGLLYQVSKGILSGHKIPTAWLTVGPHMHRCTAYV